MQLLFILSLISYCNTFVITSPLSKQKHQFQQQDDVNTIFTRPSTTISSVTSSSTTSTSLYGKKPQRLEENSSGPLYVNSACINCAACSNFAPSVFSRSPTDNYHIVHKQPSKEDLEEARAALAACPVSAIRVTTSAELNHANKGHRLNEEEEILAKNMAINEKVNGLIHPFPRPLFSSEGSDEMEVPNVHYLGHHDSKSFGAIPYMVRGTSPSGETINVMIDAPKFTPSAVKAVSSLTGEDGPDYLILTHTDDVGDHDKWAKHFEGKLKRVFHAKDLEENNWIGDEALNDVEILLRGDEKSDENKLRAWNIDGKTVSLVDKHDDNDSSWPVDEDEENVGDFVIMHTPGHSPGSISLLFRSSSSSVSTNVLFTGDTYAYTTRNNGQMTGFPRYGDDSIQQSHTLKKMLDLSHYWDVIAPGHGHVRDYRRLGSVDDSLEKEKSEAKREEMEGALKELLLFGGR